MKNIMLHTADKKKEKQIMELCSSMGLSVKLLTEKDINKMTGKLAEINFSPVQTLCTENRKAPAGYILPDLIVFAGLDSERLDEFLEAYKKAQIAPTGLKAVITPYNLTWSLYTLVSELVREQAKL